MRKLLTFVLISAMSAMSISCNNADTPQSVNQEVTSNSKTNLAARGEGQEIKDPSNLTPEEQKELISEAVAAVEYFTKNPEAEEFGTQSGRKAVTLCHDSYNSQSGNACVYNSSGYLVNVTWGPKALSPSQGSGGIYPPDAQIVYTGTIVSQCNC